jgi:hypothetical protein
MSIAIFQLKMLKPDIPVSYINHIFVILQSLS